MTKAKKCLRCGKFCDKPICEKCIDTVELKRMLAMGEVDAAMQKMFDMTLNYGSLNDDCPNENWNW